MRGTDGRPPRPGRGSPLLVDQVVHGDAVRILRRMDRGSVHLAITSPPYNVGIAYDGYTDDRGYTEYLGWLKTVWSALLPVLAPGGRFALNVAPTSIKDFHPVHHDLARDLRGLGYILRTEIIWYKQTMGRRTAWGSWRSPANPHVVPSWEYVLVFSKETWRLPGDPQQADMSSEEFQTFSDGFWEIPPERNRRGHPAPFPDELIRRLVKFYSYRGNFVLDMFGGTGTVASVARSLGRHYLSIDASPEYSAAALERVRAAPELAEAPIPAPPRVLEESTLTQVRATDLAPPRRAARPPASD